ncbi:MAG: class I SAM-dependent methyltransferase [Gammaproteobacteria bacterium]|nr:class I SAM-dependent methyltransferase [Gammaproteobacteria bacterium]
MIIVIVLAVALLLFAGFTFLRLLRRLNVVEQRLLQQPRQLFNQFESYLYLRDRLNLKQGLPYSRDWSAAADFLKVIVDHVLQHKPKVVLECSSGLSTVVLAKALALNGEGQLWSLENGAEYAQRTRDQLQRLQLEATVLDAPLQQVKINEAEYQWYDLQKLPNLSIDLLVIDGPAGFIQKNSRYPALPLLRDKLAPNALIFLDDAAREDELDLVRQWQREYPDFEYEYLNLERGCALIRVKH